MAVSETADLSCTLIQLKAGHIHNSCQPAAEAMCSQSLTNQLQAFSKHNTTYRHQLHPLCLSLSHTHSHTYSTDRLWTFWLTECLLWQRERKWDREKKKTAKSRDLMKSSFTCGHRWQINWHTLCMCSLILSFRLSLYILYQYYSWACTSHARVSALTHSLNELQDLFLRWSFLFTQARYFKMTIKEEMFFFFFSPWLCDCVNMRAVCVCAGPIGM